MSFLLRIPSVTQIAQMLEALLGRTVEARPLAGCGPVPQTVITAQLSSDAEEVLWTWSLEAACAVAAALSLVPPAVADEGVARRRMPELLRENFCEVMNVCASLFTDIGRVRHGPITFPPEAKPELNAGAESRSERFSLEVAGYKRGVVLLTVRRALPGPGTHPIT